MDKQPPLTDSWEPGLSPYTPVIRDGKLYGRGGADDGYATFSAISAVKALQLQGIPHSRIVLIVEACEESGSYDLPFYIQNLGDEGMLGKVELIICLDSGCGNYDQFWLTTSLRGLAGGNLHVRITREGVHSGAATGIIPSTMRIMRQLLDRIEDSKTGEILIKEFHHPSLPQQRVDQAHQAAAFLGDGIWNSAPFVAGARPISFDNAELLLNKTWRPSLAITGADGFPHVSKAGNVLRPETVFKLSMRVPPEVDADKAQKALKEILERDPPYGAEVKFEGEPPAAGWASPILAEWLNQSIQKSSNQFFKKPAAMFGEGGSIPFMGMLGKQFPTAQFVITGVLGPQSNAHGPNEYFHIDMSKGVTYCVTHVIHDFFLEKSK